MRTDTRKVRSRLGSGQEAPVATGQLTVHVVITGEKRWLKTSAWDCEHTFSGISPGAC